MRHSLRATLAVALFVCAITATDGFAKKAKQPRKPRVVRACFEEKIGGRLLHDPGVIVREYDDANGHWIEFQGQFWPHPIPVRRVNKFCALASLMPNDNSAANAAPREYP